MSKTVKLNERIKIFGTGKVTTYPKGQEFKIHPLLADKLIKDGKASKKE